ncbi:serendipity locus protein beta-like isoform X2 [Condylostylus longicornis]|uniref:serendipity locus protein beta-like isoform X2 n=1 Tax=Condylostylus longicornis TaxID=2530218 RepID=UPI00244E55F5|nr:serendipity locus protein beta-like isoform X2 [Condylostylus longicornis]
MMKKCETHNEHHMENKINIGKFNCEDSSFNQDCENTNSKDNRNCERVQTSIDSIYLNVSSNEHVGSKDRLEKVDSDISDAYFQYVNTDFEKFGQEVDIFGETSARNILQNQCVSQSNSIMQPNGKEKNKKAETFVELECGNFYCTICGNKITKFNVKKHDHSRYKHQCNICYKLFISDISLSLHSRNYHKEHNALEKILCEICGESIFKSKLNYHLKLHDESRYLFQCDLCKKKFMSQNRLRNHTKVIHTKKFTSNKYKWIKKN